MFIYLDESGDLGFDLGKSKTSAFFVITLLICDSKQISKAFIKSVQRTLKNKVRRKNLLERELKGTKSTLSVKRYFYGQLPENGWSLYTLCIDKRKLMADFREYDKRKLYNFFARLLLEKVCFQGDLKTVNLIVDRSKGKSDIREFNQYIENYVAGLLPFKTVLHISHDVSHNNPALQAVDLFCWGIARKYSANDKSWYDLFSRKILVEEVFSGG